MKRQAHCSKKQGRKGNTNFIMLTKSQTVEPHVIKIHAAISQIRDFLKKRKENYEKENLIPLATQKEPQKRNTVSLSLHTFPKTQCKAW